MKVIAERVGQPGAPLIRLYIHSALHRRMHTAALQRYREVL
jgi:hypothetical protein